MMRRDIELVEQPKNVNVVMPLLPGQQNIPNAVISDNGEKK